MVKHKPPFDSLSLLLSSIRRLWHHRWRLILIVQALVVVLVWVLALTQPRKLTGDV
jgi:hypothetical protein